MISFVTKKDGNAAKMELVFLSSIFYNVSILDKLGVLCMLVLDKQNIIPYLQARYPNFCAGGSVSVSEIGDSEEDNPGLINHIYRVSNGRESMIVKQGLEQIRSSSDFFLPPNRNRTEYLTLKLRGEVIGKYVPKLYGCDYENNIFCMEDVSYLGNARVELTKGKMFPNLGPQMAEYVATANFYSSEFYLDTPTFRNLCNTFTNTDMRAVMENWLFLREAPFPPNPELEWVQQALKNDKEFIAENFLLRHKFMSCPETLVHADTHTSNIFLDENIIKIIDMEYTFGGPFCYDLGYFISSLITQFCGAYKRPFPSEEDRCSYQAYILTTIVNTYEYFVCYFKDFWDKDAKEVYRSCPAWRDKLMEGFLPDVLGFAALPIFAPIIGSDEGWMDVAVIPDPTDRRNIKYLLILLARHLLLNRSKYATIRDAVADMVKVSEDYLNKLVSSIS